MRVVRMIIYEGERFSLEGQLGNSMPDGVKFLPNGIMIFVATLRNNNWEIGMKEECENEKL